MARASGENFGRHTAGEPILDLGERAQLALVFPRSGLKPTHPFTQRRVAVWGRLRRSAPTPLTGTGGFRSRSWFTWHRCSGSRPSPRERGGAGYCRPTSAPEDDRRAAGSPGFYSFAAESADDQIRAVTYLNPTFSRYLPQEPIASLYPQYDHCSSPL